MYGRAETKVFGKVEVCNLNLHFDYGSFGSLHSSIPNNKF